MKVWVFLDYVRIKLLVFNSIFLFIGCIMYKSGF